MLGTTAVAQSLLADRLHTTEIRDPQQLIERVYLRDLDQKYRCYSYRFRKMTTVVSESMPALSIMASRRFGPFAISYLVDNAGVSASILGDGLSEYCITTVLSGYTIFCLPGIGSSVRADQRHGVLYHGVPDTHVLSDDGNIRLNFWFPTSIVEERLESLLEEPIGVPLTFAPLIDWSTSGGAAVGRVIGHLVDELTCSNILLAHATFRASAEDMLAYSLLHGLDHNYTDRLETRKPSPVPRAVRRAEEFLRTHLTEPVTLQDMARAAGCSIRSLQLSFRRFRGTTPLAALREFRLEGARAELLRSEPDISVRTVAQKYGFNHLGRFAQFYRQRYGNYPSELRRTGW